MQHSKKNQLASLVMLSVSMAVLTGSLAILFQPLELALNHARQWPGYRAGEFAVMGLGWGLAALLWRQRTSWKRRQEQLEHANAELLRKQQELQHLTRLDGLTGLYNRNTFVELTHRELARARRQSCDATLLLLDMDHFRSINETWGHPAGDAVLRKFALVANNSVRVTDLVGRLGGEEFIILLPNTPLEAGRWLAEKLRANLEQNPTAWHEGSIHSTVSIGVASTATDQYYDFDHLYSQADLALYRAKNTGRNRVA